MSLANGNAQHPSKDVTPFGKKKSPRKQTDQPSFCDASASVVASTFGARRLPELKDMWLAATTTTTTTATTTATTTTAARVTVQMPDISIRSLQSGGCKTSNRHLRRRATSYKSRNKRYRFPTRKQKPAVGDNATKEEKQLSRRARRSKRPLLRATHEQSWQIETEFSLIKSDNDASITQKKDGDDDSSLRLPSVRWMSTHLWHAKRFHVEKLFSWQVPMMHTNRGSQAALRLAHEKCVIQDATWCSQPIWFSVSQTVSLSAIASLLRSMIPTFVIPDDMMSSSKKRIIFGEGIIYRPRLFPRASCGPISWFITEQPWNRHAPSKQSDSWYVYLIVYPSMQSTILSDINKLLNFSELKHSTVGPKLFVNGGLACFRLRGSSSNACLKQGLQCLDWEPNALSTMEEYLSAPRTHLSPLVVHYQLTSNRSKDNRFWDPLYICRQAPRNEKLVQNVGVSGYDIYCSTSCASEIFQSLTLRGGACPIGWMEQAHLCLEAEPPFPVYPRDFPDTLDGRLYWSTLTTSTKYEASNTCDNQWQIVRRYFEGGTGRVPRAVHMKAIDWCHLLMDSYTLEETIPEATSWPNLALVRGVSFGEPFRQVLQAIGPPLLQGAVHEADASKSTSKRKRKRRPERAPSAIVQSPCFGKQQLSVVRETCENMLKSLSLPALLLVHVDISGKGTLRAGDLLYSMNKDSPIVLGAVTSGCFSPSRGHCHGMAFVGCALFLKVVAAVDQDFPLYVVIGCDKSRELRLGVRISRSKRNEESEKTGTVSIML